MKELLFVLSFGNIFLVSQSKILPFGIDPITCPDYPHCPIPVNPNPILGFPFVCPNYPFCNEDSKSQNDAVNYVDPATTVNVAAKSTKLDTNCHFEDFLCTPLRPDVIETLTDKKDAASCQEACKGSSSCNYFTYTKYFTFSECHLMRSCTSTKQRCSAKEHCTSGSKQCTCPPLDKKPKQGHARWYCEGGLDPYKKSSPVGTKCSISCATWEDSENKITGLTLQSTCLPGLTWSTTTTDAYNTSSLVPTSYYKWPKPDEADPQCKTCTDLGPFLQDPNLELGADFTCDGWSRDQFSRQGGFTIKSQDVCQLRCNDKIVSNIRCNEGVWSATPDNGFYCFKRPAELKSTTSTTTTTTTTTSTTTTSTTRPVTSKLYSGTQYDYYKVQVSFGRKLVEGTVPDTCRDAGMQAVCPGDDKCNKSSDKCVVTPLRLGYAHSCWYPMGPISEKICQGKEPKLCGLLEGVFNYMNDWNGSECGRIGSTWCAAGKSYTSTREKPLYGLCAKRK